jgi:hypothetical protein
MKGGGVLVLLALTKNNNNHQLPSAAEELQSVLLRGQKEHQKLLRLQSGEEFQEKD